MVVVMVMMVFMEFIISILKNTYLKKKKVFFTVVAILHKGP